MGMSEFRGLQSDSIIQKFSYTDGLFGNGGVWISEASLYFDNHESMV